VRPLSSGLCLCRDWLGDERQLAGGSPVVAEARRRAARGGCARSARCRNGAWEAPDQR